MSSRFTSNFLAAEDIQAGRALTVLQNGQVKLLDSAPFTRNLAVVSNGAEFWRAKVDTVTGDVYVTGTFRGTFGVPSIGFTATSAQLQFFVGKTNSLGEWQWIVPYEGETGGLPLSLALDLYSNDARDPSIYVGGYFGQRGNFSRDGFIARFDVSSRAFAYTLPVEGFGDERVQGLTLNPQNGFLGVLGSYTDEIQFFSASNATADTPDITLTAQRNQSQRNENVYAAVLSGVDGAWVRARTLRENATPGAIASSSALGTDLFVCYNAKVPAVGGSSGETTKASVERLTIGLEEVWTDDVTFVGGSGEGPLANAFSLDIRLVNRTGLSGGTIGPVLDTDKSVLIVGGSVRGVVSFPGAGTLSSSTERGYVAFHRLSVKPSQSTQSWTSSKLLPLIDALPAQLAQRSVAVRILNGRGNASVFVAAAYDNGGGASPLSNPNQVAVILELFDDGTFAGINTFPEVQGDDVIYELSKDSNDNVYVLVDDVQVNQDGGRSVSSTLVKWIRNSDPLIGVASADAQKGANVTVTLLGLSTAHTNLVPRKYYYAATLGSLTLEKTATRVGLATSPSELFLGRTDN